VKKELLLIAILALGTSAASAWEVMLDYDKSVDFSQYKTFAWQPTPKISLQESSPAMHSRVKNAIEYQLTTGGLIEDTEAPDLRVTYYTSVREEFQLQINNFGYGYGRGWHSDMRWGAGYAMTHATTRTFPVGTLVIDIWDVKTKKAVWRGSTTGVVPAKPAKAARKIEKAIQKMAREWDKKYQPPSK